MRTSWQAGRISINPRIPDQQFSNCQTPIPRPPTGPIEDYESKVTAAPTATAKTDTETETEAETEIALGRDRHETDKPLLLELLVPIQRAPSTP